MTPMEAGFIVTIIFILFIAILGQQAAYRNGVTDGYGYSREPKCPGYRVAGDYLRRHMAHRWPELKLDPDDDEEDDDDLDGDEWKRGKRPDGSRTWE